MLHHQSSFENIVSKGLQLLLVRLYGYCDKIVVLVAIFAYHPLQHITINQLVYRQGQATKPCLSLVIAVLYPVFPIIGAPGLPTFHFRPALCNSNDMFHFIWTLYVYIKGGYQFHFCCLLLSLEFKGFLLCHNPFNADLLISVFYMHRTLSSNLLRSCELLPSSSLLH